MGPEDLAWLKPVMVVTLPGPLWLDQAIEYLRLSYVWDVEGLVEK